MEIIALIAQVVIAVGILNVWLLRFGRPTRWRGGGARNMREEFANYGLPGWTVRAVGLAKLGLASVLLAGVFVPALTPPAAAAMALLMLAAVGTHVKIRDPLERALPAASLFALCVLVALA